MELVRKLHAGSGIFRGGFLKYFEQETSVPECGIDFQPRDACRFRHGGHILRRCSPECICRSSIAIGIIVTVTTEQSKESPSRRRISYGPIGSPRGIFGCGRYPFAFTRRYIVLIRDVVVVVVVAVIISCRYKQIGGERNGFRTETAPIDSRKAVFPIDPNVETIIQDVPPPSTIQKQGSGIPSLPGTHVFIHSLVSIPPPRIQSL
mmetsp:Transcript_9870/g.29322  ORF Transcript_9870/g.29322 Transcript_9870/m.29322 type:complete len:206 (-) Transcript_9870:630-1247(-)